jgi:hypothetical protein
MCAYESVKNITKTLVRRVFQVGDTDLIMEALEERGRARKSARPTEAVGAKTTFLMAGNWF